MSMITAGGHLVFACGVALVADFGVEGLLLKRGPGLIADLCIMGMILGCVLLLVAVFMGGYP